MRRIPVLIHCSVSPMTTDASADLPSARGTGSASMTGKRSTSGTATSKSMAISRPQACRVSHQLSGQVSLSCVMVWKSGRSALAAVRPLTASARQVHMQSRRLFIRFPPVCRFHQVCGDAPKARRALASDVVYLDSEAGVLVHEEQLFLATAGLPHIKAWREGLSAAHAITGKLPAGAVWFNPPLILPPFNKSGTFGLTHPPYTFIRTKNQGGK